MQDYKLDIYLRQQWHDDRLRSTGEPDRLLLVSRRSVIDQLWTPDIYFLNVKVSSLMDAWGLRKISRNVGINVAYRRHDISCGAAGIPREDSSGVSLLF